MNTEKLGVCKHCDEAIEWNEYRGHWKHTDGYFLCRTGTIGNFADPLVGDGFPVEFDSHFGYPVESNSGSENRVAQNMGPKNRSAMFESGEAQPNPAAPQTGGSLSDTLFDLTKLLYDNRHKLRAVGIEEDVLQSLESMGEAWDRVLDTFGVEERDDPQDIVDEHDTWGL